jgi:hypothetical protein
MRGWPVALVAGAVSFGPSGSLAADPPRLVTNFNFEVKFADGPVTYNGNLDRVINVWIPPAIGWQCLRLGVSNVEGRARSSFACSNDGFRTEVLTLVGCKPNETDPRHTAALRLYGPRPDGMPQGSPVDAGADASAGFNPAFGTLLDLAVSCETVPVR